MNNRTLLKYHSFFGLITGLFLVISGISGAILAFNEDIDQALFKKYEAQAAPEVLHIDKAIATIQDNFPKWEVRLIHFKKGETLLFNLRRPEARKYVFIHPQTGAIIAAINANTQFTKWLLKLHYSLHAGITGKIAVLLIGVLFFLSIITGIILYRKVILKALLFRVRINRNHKRNFYSTLHRYIGVWSLFLNLILVITGILLAYTVTKSGLQASAAPDPPEISASVEKSLELIGKEYPDFLPTYIRLPKQRSAEIIVNGKFKNDPFYLSEVYNKIRVNYQTGQITSVTKIKDAPLNAKLNSMVSPLHFGQFGGIWSKLLYCLIGLSGPFLSVTGFFIWYRRAGAAKHPTVLSFRYGK